MIDRVDQPSKEPQVPNEPTHAGQVAVGHALATEVLRLPPDLHSMPLEMA